MRTYLKANRWIWCSYLLFLACGIVLKMSIDKGQETLFAQSVRSPFLDWTLYIVTLVFEFPYLLLTALVLLVYSFRLSTLVLIAYGFSSIITQAIKRVLEWPRPARFFEMQGIELDSLVKNIEGHLPCCNTFPSGHTTIAFTICFTILLSIKSVTAKSVLLILAVLIAISRVYLAVHFTEDVLAGSFVGVVGAMICCCYLLPLLRRIPKEGIISLGRN